MNKIKINAGTIKIEIESNVNTFLKLVNFAKSKKFAKLMKIYNLFSSKEIKGIDFYSIYEMGEIKGMIEFIF